jgi:hypothetical protein
MACLICGFKEKSASLNTPYICAKCVFNAETIRRSDVLNLIEKYRKAKRREDANFLERMTFHFKFKV